MQRESKTIKTIPRANEVMNIPNCPTCSRRGIKRNDCDYYETEETCFFTGWGSTEEQAKYHVKTYAYFCGHYRNISREL